MMRKLTVIAATVVETFFFGSTGSRLVSEAQVKYSERSVCTICTMHTVSFCKIPIW